MTSTNPIDALLAGNIRAELGRHRISGQALAARLGLGPQSMRGRLRGEVPITVAELVAIAVVLDLDPIDLIPAPLSVTRAIA